MVPVSSALVRTERESGHVKLSINVNKQHIRIASIMLS